MFNEKLLKISLGFILLLIIVGFFTINYILNDDNSTPSYTSSPSTKRY